MKKLLTTLFALSLVQVSFGQAQRLVLVEEFTQASCPPCATQNPGFNTLLQDNPTKVIALKYQVWWPGYDPMYLHNTTDVTDRVDYYGVNGVPHGLVDGVTIPDDCGYYDGAPACLSQSDIDAAYGITSPFNLTLNHTLSSDADSIYITLDISAVGSANGTIKARIAVMEKEILFNAPPGSNGELDFYEVMKKMLPNADGTSLPGSISSGYTNTINVSWKLANIYDISEVAVVAWIQDDVSKDILQSVYSAPQPISTFAQINAISNPAITCTGSIVASVTLENSGSSALTSADISYALDNGTPLTYTWNGNLNSGANTSVALPAITVPSGAHTFNAWVSAVNGSPLNAGVILPLSFMNGIGAPSAAPVVEGFVSTTFPPANWIVVNPDNADEWKRNSQDGGFQQSNNSTWYSFYSSPAGAVDELYVENFDFSNTSETEATLEFAIAKAEYNGFNDQLMILASTDCGSSWTTLFDKDDQGGLNTITSSANWNPAQASQWRQEVVDISSLIGETNVVVKFVAVSGYGNNMYVDDINIHYGGPVGISEPVNLLEVGLFPNPATNNLNLQVNGTLTSAAYIEFINEIGQLVLTVPVRSSFNLIDVSFLSSGLYQYLLIDDGKLISQNKFSIIR